MKYEDGLDEKIIKISSANIKGSARELLNLKNESVLLVTDNHGPTERTIKYAANLCRHTGSSLLLINTAPDDSGLDEFKVQLKECMPHLKDIQWSLAGLKGPVTDVLRNLSKSTDKIISIILDKEWLDRQMPGKRHRKWLNKLGCPVVLVDKKDD